MMSSDEPSTAAASEAAPVAAAAPASVAPVAETIKPAAAPERKKLWSRSEVWVLGAFSVIGLIGFIATFVLIMLRAPNAPVQRTLTAAEIQRLTGPAGERGPVGPAGPRGATGDAAVRVVRGDVDVDLTDVAHVCLRVDDDLRIVRTDLQRNRAPVRENRDASLAVQLRREQSLTGHGAAYCSAHTALRRESDYRTLEVTVVCEESVGFDGEH